MPRKRTGSVERKGERFLARVGREYLGSFESEEQARRIIKAALIDEKSRAADSFSALGEAWMRQQEQLARMRRGRDSVFQTTWRAWNRYIAPAPFYHKRARKVTRDELRALITSIVGRPRMRPGPGGKLVKHGDLVGRPTAVRVRALLTAFFDECPGLESNPATRIKIPNAQRIIPRDDSDRITHLHLDEIERLFALPQMTPVHRAMYSLGVYGGLRKSEILGMRWENIRGLDTNTPELHVRHSYNVGTKTERSQREVPMLPQLAAAVREYRESLGAVPIKGFAGLVFPRRDGQHGARSRQHRPRWTDRVDKTGHVTLGYRTLARIRECVDFRHLRHSCGTHLGSGAFTFGYELPMAKIQLWLGHETERMTARHYAQRDVDELHGELAKAQSKNQLKK
jgi:integrase